MFESFNILDAIGSLLYLCFVVLVVGIIFSGDISSLRETLRSEKPTRIEIITRWCIPIVDLTVFIYFGVWSLGVFALLIMRIFYWFIWLLYLLSIRMTNKIVAEVPLFFTKGIEASVAIFKSVKELLVLTREKW